MENNNGSIRLIHSARITARHIVSIIPHAIRQPSQRSLRTLKAKRSRTIANEIMTDIQTRQDFLVRTGSNSLINPLISGSIRPQVARGEVGPVFLISGIPQNMLSVIAREIGTSWNRHGAEPILVGTVAIPTADREGVHGRVAKHVSIALDLVE